MIRKTPSEERVWLNFYQKEISNLEPSNFTQYEYLIKENQYNLDKICIYSEDKSFTFGEFFKLICCYQTGLTNLNVNSDDVVSILAESSEKYLAFYYASNKTGAAFATIDPRTPNSYIKDILNRLNSKVLIVQEIYWEKISEIASEVVQSVNKIIILPGPWHENLRLNENNCVYPNVISYNTFLENIIKTNEKAKTKEKAEKTDCELEYLKSYPYYADKVAMIQHTGGTTGSPKSCMLTNLGLNTLPDYYFKKFETRLKKNSSTDVTYITGFPVYSASGLHALHIALIFGSAVVCVDDISPEKFPDYVKKYKPVSISCLPIMLENLILSPDMKDLDLTGLNRIIVGGDYLSKDRKCKIYQFLKEHNCPAKLVINYGMTELSTAAVGHNSGADKEDALGIPFPGVVVGIFKIDEETGESSDIELNYNEIGEICFYGRNLMSGYFNDEKRTNDIIKRHSDGKLWLHTNDVGYIDEEGYVYMVDRINNMLKYDGQHIYPADIDALIDKMDGIISVKTVGKDVLGRGQAPITFIMLYNPKDKINMEKKIKKEIKENLLPHSHPKKIVFLDKMPLTRVGKINVTILKDLANRTT
ncbi:MAG: acyl--CoA ligase [Methanosarcinaceae archaeon]|nr:acyl--CoA ligase [Methanosarcinaceae archaeon]